MITEELRRFPVERFEIVWHARGGQGAKTASQMVAHAALSEGKHAQGFPEYGPERMGAPTRGYTRISDKPIRVHSPITEPDVVIILDETLIEAVPVTEGATQKTVFLVNTGDEPERARKRLGVENRVYTLDATSVSMEELGRPIPNVPMMGALARVTGLLPLEAFVNDIKHKFGKKFAEKVVEGNIRALKRGYEAVKGLEEEE